MVRVVSCHHFISQDVFLSESEPVAFCGAQDKLLVSTTQHAINVHDLEARGNVLHSFPTVDIVKQIIYCEAGNYVATIESKVSWHSSLVAYVRIYFKWWIEAKSQSLRVRVAGASVIPEDNNLTTKNQFEMVELPLEKPALYISSCNKTSSLTVSLGNILSIFCYTTKIHPTFRQTYHDFDHFADVTIPFIVQELKICENYFACMSDKIIHVFKIVYDNDEDDAQKVSNASGVEENDELELKDENFVEWRFESCTYSGAKDKEWENHIKSKLHPNSFPINIHLHAIDKANENFSGNDECEFYGPLLTIRGCTVDVRLNPKTFEMFPSISSNLYAVTLLFRQFSFKESDTKLKYLQLMPFYKSISSEEQFVDPLNAAAFESEHCSFSLPWPNMTSSSVSSLTAIGVFFSTSKEGFLYNLTNKTEFISSYTYTSMMKGVVLETSLLHALTETGLETYTVHLPHSVLLQIEVVDEVKNKLPKFEDEICLLGLRPFLGVDHLVKSDNHLVLVSSVEDSVSNTDSENGNRSTLYSLKEPDAVQVFSDLLEVADSQKVSSPITYHDLLSEAHMLLRTQVFLGVQNKEIETLFRNSCLLLGDYFLSADVNLKQYAVPYYHLSQLDVGNIVKRILDFRQSKYGNILKPLTFYMNSVIFDDSEIDLLSLPQAIADAVISAYAEEAPEMLWKVIMCSRLIGYKHDKAILILKRRLTNKRHPLSPISNAADTVALVYLLMLKGTIEAAENVILSVSKSDLSTILTNIHSKLWTGGNLTPFCKFVKQTRPDAFVDLLINYVDKKKFDLSDVVQLLQSESPNTDLHCVPLLKEFLEEILKDKSMKTDSAAMALLVKIYLKQLLQPKENKDSSSTSQSSVIVCSFSHFFASRVAWLNEMPPFNGRISRTCMRNSSNNGIENEKTDYFACSCWNCNEDLLRIQSLLSYVGPVEEIKGMVLEFLHSAERENSNWISLEIMCSSEAQAIKMLIRMAPKALMPYAKETFQTDKRKWFLLFSLLNEHMESLPEDHPNAESYSKTFHTVLAHLSETLTVPELLQLLPQGQNDIFLPHVKRCVERHQADKLKNKIVSLGQEIKSMMHS